MKTLYEINLKITDKWLKDCNEYQRMFSGISLTPKQMLKIFKKDKHLLFLSKLYGFDTGEREQFMSLLSKHLIGIDWPTYGDSGKSKYKDFDEKLAKAAKKKGYDVIGT